MCSRRGATGSSQRANALLIGYPVTKTIIAESNATHDIKNYYKNTQGTQKHDKSETYTIYFYT